MSSRNNGEVCWRRVIMKKNLNLKSFAQQVGLDNVLTYRPKAEKMYNIAIQSVAPISAGDVLICSFEKIDASDIS